MGHVCQALPLNILQKAINGGIVDKGFIDIIKVCEKFAASDDDQIVQDSDVLLVRIGLAGGFGFESCETALDQQMIGAPDLLLNLRCTDLELL